MKALKLIALGVLFVGLTIAQTAVPKFVVGTVTGFKAESAEIQVKPDSGDVVSLKLRGDTQVQRVPPGEKDLKKAEPIQITDVSTGDRVLVNLMPTAFEARRIVVMSSSDIAKQKEADRIDWTKRGVIGLVAAKKGNEITLRMRSMQAERTATVTVSESTRFERYSPDSVKFADAKKSSLAEISVGDQVRARGQKSEDGLKITAEEVVFGTFVTKAGPITSVNVEAKEITVKEMATGKPLVIKLTEDSQLKTLPDFRAMMQGAAPGSPGAKIAAMHTGGGPPDLVQILELVPAIKIEDLKPGETVVVSSTKGANAGKITAIMLVSNADILIKFASMQAAAGAKPGAAAGGGAGMGGMGGGMGGMMSGGMGGLDLGGMFPTQ